MFKKGGLGSVLFLVLELTFLILLVGGLVSKVHDQAEGRTYEKKYFARDFALLYDTLQLSNYPLSADYQLLKDKYKLNITQKGDYFYVDITTFGESFANRYPLIVHKDFVIPSTQLGKDGIQTLTISGNGQVIGVGQSYDTGEINPALFSRQEGTLDYPVKTTDRTVTSCFGLRGDALNEENEPESIDCHKKGTHCGVDFRARNSEKAVAVTDGTITAVLFGENNWGTIILRPDGIDNVEFVYLHLRSFCPTPGTCIKEQQHVNKGDEIGITGNTVPSWYKGTIYPHLHFEMIYDETRNQNGEIISDKKKVDPLASGLFNLKEINFKQGINCDLNKEAYSYREDIERGIGP